MSKEFRLYNVPDKDLYANKIKEERKYYKKKL